VFLDAPDRVEGAFHIAQPEYGQDEYHCSANSAQCLEVRSLDLRNDALLESRRTRRKFLNQPVGEIAIDTDRSCDGNHDRENRNQRNQREVGERTRVKQQAIPNEPLSGHDRELEQTDRAPDDPARGRFFGPQSLFEKSADLLGSRLDLQIRPPAPTGNSRTPSERHSGKSTESSFRVRGFAATTKRRFSSVLGPIP